MHSPSSELGLPTLSKPAGAVSRDAFHPRSSELEIKHRPRVTAMT
jgi:hypothetical protein